jgi:class 3 adenylate cyclase/tetratricopeptide (TPR) repeat protein
VPTCANCGQENPDIAKFCLACATPLAQTAHPAREERKVVTALFCDLVGFTALSDHADPEDVRARIRPYHARLREELEGYGGTVEKFIGDAVMAVFGAPVAHEDDAERAVRAGLRILEAIEDMNELDPNLQLQVRVGIETGEAVVALDARPEAGEGMVTGDVVNTASRLQGAAPVNAVVVGEQTFAATKGVFDYQALEPVMLKGKAEPVPLFQALAARARFGTDVTRTFGTPLVGRELERGLLTGVFERAVRESSVQLVTIVGEPGVGKSRLVAELGTYIDEWPDLIRWRQGRSLPYGSAVTFWALGEIVKAEAGILESDSPEVAAVKIDAAVPDHADAPWVRQRLRPLVGLEAPEAAREENFAAWRGYLEHLAEHRPSVFIFEDLHWADDALLAFLEHMADYAQGVPIVLLGTSRPELFERAPTWASRARNATRINLSPLSEADTARLISNLLEQAVLPAEVQATILSRSGGNPLYAEEYVRLLKDRGILAKRGSTWALEPGAEIPLPSGVHATIAARLDTVDPDRKRMLQDAAVVGKVFWTGAVASIGGQDRAVIDAAMHELSRKELIRPVRRSSMEGESEYSFFHALLRDVCYSQIPRAERGDRHRRAAAWIEQMAGERAEDHAEILASHYLTALELDTAAGAPGAEQLEAKAARYLTLAGDRAIGMDVEAAERHYAKALELSRVGRDRPNILLRHAEALRQRGRYREAAPAIEEAIQGFRENGDVRSMAVALSRKGMFFQNVSRQMHRDASAEALATLESVGPSPELVQVLTEASASSMVAYEPDSALALADRALVLATELGLPEPLRALGFRGSARALLLGDPGGFDDMWRALEAARAQGLGREAAVLYNNLAEGLCFAEGPRGTLRVAREGSDFAERRGIDEFVLALSPIILEALVDLGSYDEAQAMSGGRIADLEAVEDIVDLILVRHSEARMLLRQGHAERVWPDVERMMEAAREHPDAETTASMFSIAAEVRHVMGDRDGAVALLKELEAVAYVNDVRAFLKGLPAAVAIALAAGDSDLAMRLLDRVTPRYSLHEHVLVAARAVFAEDRSDHDEASELFFQAAQRWKGFEMPWEEGQALLGRGRCLIALGRAPEARDSLRAARDLFTPLRAVPAIAEVDSCLERGVARTS